MTLSPQDDARSEAVPGILRPIERHRRTIIVGVALLLAVVVFGVALAKTRAVTGLDLGVDVALSRVHGVPVTNLALAVYKLFSPPFAIGLTVVVALIIWAATRNWRSALTFSVVVVGSWLSSYVVKIFVGRPRPSAAALANPFLPTPPDPSFPSGHVVFAASIAIAFMFLARRSTRLALVVALGILAVLLTGFSVVYLGVHYPTDVIASILWAAGACPLVLLVWNRFIIPRIGRQSLATIIR